MIYEQKKSKKHTVNKITRIKNTVDRIIRECLPMKNKFENWNIWLKNSPRYTKEGYVNKKYIRKMKIKNVEVLISDYRTKENLENLDPKIFDWMILLSVLE